MKRLLIFTIIFSIFLVSCSAENENMNDVNISETKYADVSGSTGTGSSTAIDKNTGIATSIESTKEPTFKPDLKSITDLMSLNKEEVIDRLGKDYIMVKAGAEHADDGYNYEKYGMILIFDYKPSGFIQLIICNEIVDINGAKLGMTFSEIEKILGKGTYRKLVQIEPEQPLFALYYKYDNLMVWFGAAEKDGPTIGLQIR